MSSMVVIPSIKPYVIITRNNIINISLGHSVILRGTFTLHVRNIKDLGITLKDLNSHILETLIAESGLLFKS